MMPRTERFANLASLIRPVSTRVTLNNIDLSFVHLEASTGAFQQMIEELKNDANGLSRIPFQPGDVVLDIGANVGFVSICMAKMFPFLKIYAYEPVPLNYEHLVRNIVGNAVTNVVPFPLALTKDGRRLTMDCNPKGTIGSSANFRENQARPDHLRYGVNSVTLDNVLEDNGIDACRFMKMDCEGSEHEVLHNSALLNRIEYLAMEIHLNQPLRDQGYSVESLVERCKKYIAPQKLKTWAVGMYE